MKHDDYGRGRTDGFLAGKFAGSSQVITKILTFIDDPILRSKIIAAMPDVKNHPKNLAVWVEEE